MKIQIKKWTDGSIIYEGYHNDIKSAIEHCVNRNISLINADLSNANLINADLSNAVLSYANLSNAVLSYANLSNADLSNAVLSYADLSNADLSYASLINADLSYANLSNADLSSLIGEMSKIKSLFLDFYPVVYTDTHVQIGCEKHQISEWRAFDDKRILEMDGKKALTFWRKYKDFIFTAIELSPAEPTGAKEDE